MSGIGRWPRIVAPLWVVAIYSTLSGARTVSGWLREQGLLRVVVVSLFVLAFGAVVVALRVWRVQWSRSFALWLLGVFLSGAVLSTFCETLEERVHLLEYGGLAIVLAAALPRSWSTSKLALVAWLCTALIGWGDKLIQGTIPSRHYDFGDVGLNAASAGWALSALWLLRVITNRRSGT